MHTVFQTSRQMKAPNLSTILIIISNTYKYIYFTGNAKSTTATRRATFELQKHQVDLGGGVFTTKNYFCKQLPLTTRSDTACDPKLLNCVYAWTFTEDNNSVEILNSSCSKRFMFALPIHSNISVQNLLNNFFFSWKKYSIAQQLCSSVQMWYGETVNSRISAILSCGLQVLCRLQYSHVY